MIEKGEGRGWINKDNNLKVLLPPDNEGIWVKVVALSKDKMKGVGILSNDPFGNGKYKWGDFVKFEETSSKEIPKITGKSSKIPNLDGWELI